MIKTSTQNLHINGHPMDIEDFFEHEHGYVFNKAQLKALLAQTRNQSIDECVAVCANLGNLTVPTETGEEFKFVYIFAMNSILSLKTPR